MLWGGAFLLLAARLGLGEPAAVSEDLKKENEVLRSRVTKLEAEVQQLKDIVGKIREPAAAPAAPEGLTAADVQALKTMAQSKKTPVTSSVEIELYGSVKLDASYDSARLSEGNYARWVESEETRQSDNEFNMTAKETRLGLNLAGPDFGGGKTSGKVEIDFYGGGTENKPVPMMRHAFMKLDWPGEKFSILAGQTSDVISPLVPSTLNYTVGWWVGNIGYRRPQVRITKGWSLAEGVDFQSELAASRTIGRASGFDPGDTGEDAGFPTVQARESLAFPLFSGKQTTIGVSGHWGQEEYDLDATNRNRSLDSWSINLDLHVPVTGELAIKGEAFYGENLDAYLGGIGQGVAGDPLKEIGSCGGWIAASYGPWGSWRFTLGGSLEDVKEDDVGDGARTFNSAIFGNTIYAINEKASFGVELSRWYTDYKHLRDGDSYRVQTSFIYKF
jgi:hypothetical protein